MTAYDIDLLRRLWADNVHVSEIAARLGCTCYHVYQLRLKHGLPARGKVRTTRRADPTPEEIEQRLKEVWEMRRKGTPIGGRHE